MRKRKITIKEKTGRGCREEEARSATHRSSGYSGYSYANPSLEMRRRAAKQTMAVEPESLACSLPGPERHVGQGADTIGRLLQHPEACLQGGAPGGDGERGQDGGREGERMERGRRGEMRSSRKGKGGGEMERNRGDGNLGRGGREKWRVREER